MGYQNNTLTNGSMGAGATFQAIGKAGTMADITISGYTRPFTSGRIYCTLLDTFGREIKKMYWFDNDEVITPRGTTPARYGWYDSKGSTSYATDPIEPGQGLWFTIDNDYQINSAGQVIAGSYAVALTNGSSYVSNPMPTTIKMGQLKIEGHVRPFTSGRIYCTLLDTFGREIKKMYWFDNDEVITPRGTTPARYGWYDSKGASCYNETDEVKAGEALWFTVDNDYTLVWPKVLDAE